jgi:hypothetical protein
MSLLGGQATEPRLGAQETVGATVWPSLTEQGGYSSVLYLVS